MIDGVAQQLDKILDEYADKLDETTDAIMEKVAKDTAQNLRQTSPPAGKQGQYAKSWTVTKQKHQYIVHNKKHYRLTHLLENGHVVKNQYGTYGRWTPTRKHIEPAEEKAARDLIRELESKL